MQIENIHTVCSKFCQARVELLSQDIGLVNARFCWINFRCDGQSSLLPFCFSRKGLLLSPDVRAGSVNFTIASRLEVIKKGVVFLQRGDSSSCIGVWPTTYQEVSGGSACPQDCLNMCSKSQCVRPSPEHIVSLSHIQGHQSQNNPCLWTSSEERHCDLAVIEGFVLRSGRR